MTESRKYSDACLALGFTATLVGHEERPVCAECLKTLAADSLQPNKFKRHLETLHPTLVSKTLEFFKGSVLTVTQHWSQQSTLLCCTKQQF